MASKYVVFPLVKFAAMCTSMFDEAPAPFDDSGAAAARYRIIERIGEGKHGIVVKAIDQHHQPEHVKYVAIKKIALRTRKDEVSLDAVREIKVLQCCEHANVRMGSQFQGCP